MKTLKLIAIAAMAICFLFGMISDSSAQIDIVDMYTPSESYNDIWSPLYAYIETDRPYDTIYWYIGILDPDDGDFEYVYVEETLGDGGATRAWFYPNVSGSIKGQKYRVGAKAWYFNRETQTSTSDWESRGFRVFQSKVISSTQYPPESTVPKHQHGTGIHGCVELMRHYHDGSHIVMEGSVYAYNGTKVLLHATSWFRHTEMNTGWEMNDPPLGTPNPGKPMPKGETYYNYGSSMISFPVPTDNGNIGPTDSFTLNAHIHLDVGGRVWHEQGGAWTHEFTEEDNQ